MTSLIYKQQTGAKMKWRLFRKYSSINYCSFHCTRNTFNTRLKSTGNTEEISFPWTQTIQDNWQAQPFWHKVMGFFIMKKILQNVNAPFKNQEFLEGVQLAISAVSDAISTQNVKKLQGMMTEQLGHCFKNTFLTLSERQQNVFLELEKTKLLNITGIKSTFGKADPSDKHILRVLGQEIVGSKQKLQSVIEESKSPWNDSREIGETAAKLGVTFQLDVKFKTYERFYIEKNTEILVGSRNPRSCFHIWQFETHVDWLTWDKDRKDSYPIAWLLSDIDQFVKKNVSENDSYDTLI